MDFIQPIIDKVITSFNPADVFASVQSFLGSGYIFIAIAAILAYGVIKALSKLVAIGAVVGIIWFLCTSGVLSGIDIPLPF